MSAGSGDEGAGFSAQELARNPELSPSTRGARVGNTPGGCSVPGQDRRCPAGQPPLRSFLEDHHGEDRVLQPAEAERRQGAAAAAGAAALAQQVQEGGLLQVGAARRGPEQPGSAPTPPCPRFIIKPRCCSRPRRVLPQDSNGGSAISAPPPPCGGTPPRRGISAPAPPPETPHGAGRPRGPRVRPVHCTPVLRTRSARLSRPCPHGGGPAGALPAAGTPGDAGWGGGPPFPAVEEEYAA